MPSDLRDNITLHWKSNVIAHLLEDYVDRLGIDTVSEESNYGRSAVQPKHSRFGVVGPLRASQILTFDTQGVSGHPNHVALPRGALELVASASRSNLSVFSLDTVPILAKYSGMLHPAYYQATSKIAGLQQYPQRADRFVSHFGGYLTACYAMQAHWSQLVWFRWLYILTSRYMWLNEWTLISAARNSYNGKLLVK